MSHPAYRPDIDGLRAIAVLPVVGFHAFPGLIQGGFVGVDVFFVISGFLISSIIFSHLEQDRFSFAEFYGRRIRRIFPALVLVLAACLALGWFSFFSYEYKSLGKHVAGGAGFISNFLLWRESGYFDSTAETKPLLHLWSLAIEEQFYIVWPLLLALGWKRKWSLAGMTLAVAVASFSLNIHLIGADPMAAFYSPVARFWELMSGSLLAYVTLHKPHWIGTHKNTQAAIGAVLLALGFLLINKTRAFPGWWALLPSMGAFLVISGGQHAMFNRRILSNRVLVWFGLISYPLYLWHWPLLSMAHVIDGARSPTTRGWLVLASVLLAWATYRFVERPVRHGANGAAKIACLLSSMAVLGGAGVFCYSQDGFDGTGYRAEGRSEFARHFENGLPDWKYFEAAGIPDKFRFECDFYDIPQYRRGRATRVPLPSIDRSCFERDGRYPKSVLIWGDSHAQQLYWGLKSNLPADWQLLQVASSGCVPDPDVRQPSSTDHCAQSNWFALKVIRDSKPDVVVVARNLGQTIEDFERIAEKLKSEGIRKTVFVGPSPHWTMDLPKIIARKLWENTPTRTMVGVDTHVLADNRALQQNFRQSATQVYANLIDVFCNPEGCLTFLGEDKKSGITSWDYGHLTPVASAYLAKHMLVDLITRQGGNP